MSKTLTVKRDGETLELSLKDIVAERIASFLFYRQGYLYYTLRIASQDFSFPIPIDDLGTATLPEKVRAITLMRYIRKALEGDMLVKVSY